MDWEKLMKGDKNVKGGKMGGKIKENMKTKKEENGIKNVSYQV